MKYVLVLLAIPFLAVGFIIGLIVLGFFVGGYAALLWAEHIFNLD